MVEAVLFIEVKSRKHHMKIVIFKFIEKHRYADSKSLPLHKGAFFVHLCLINFPDKHCICGHKSEIRHTSFELYRISENCPLGYVPIGCFFHLCRQAQHRLRGTRPHHDLGVMGLTFSQLYAILSSGKAVHDDICYLKY